ncbi:hypothetical protein [Clostridium sp. BJN0013]|uniref:hypothetical protein n=1 Tax=Clostridium sp. BJN0013 TaxID=3236840 RepID=UPI0034C65416
MNTILRNKLDDFYVDDNAYILIEILDYSSLMDDRGRMFHVIQDGNKQLEIYAQRVHKGKNDGIDNWKFYYRIYNNGKVLKEFETSMIWERSELRDISEELKEVGLISKKIQRNMIISYKKE